MQSFILDTLKSSYRTRASLCYQRDVLYSVHGEALKSRYFHIIAKLENIAKILNHIC